MEPQPVLNRERARREARTKLETDTSIIGVFIFQTLLRGLPILSLLCATTLFLFPFYNYCHYLLLSVTGKEQRLYFCWSAVIRKPTRAKPSNQKKIQQCLHTQAHTRIHIHGRAKGLFV